VTDRKLYQKLAIYHAIHPVLMKTASETNAAEFVRKNIRGAGNLVFLDLNAVSGQSARISVMKIGMAPNKNIREA
jgi:hypothetical protein